MAPRQIATLVAMPAALRPLLLRPAPTPELWSQLWLQMHAFHASCQACAKSTRAMKGSLNFGAFTTHGAHQPPSRVPVDVLLESPDPDKSLSAQLWNLFIKNPPALQYANSSFYDLKKNTRIPEICILGRSNVGKSTFLNALANRMSRELAHTSSKAGRTRSINAYGFGPAPTIKSLEGTDPSVKRTEALPTHSFYVVDMPGYGHKSKKEWGDNIALYLTKRQSLTGAVVLIDGGVGLKPTDKMVLEMLREAKLRTMVVLTKADKAKNEASLQEVCKEVSQFMWKLDSQHTNATWEWDRDIFVTAVGCAAKYPQTIDIARLAVARMTGLVTEKARLKLEQPKASWGGKIVSFEDIQYARTSGQADSLTTSTPPPSLSKRAESALSALERPRPARSWSQPKPPEPSGFAALERAARQQHEGRSKPGRQQASFFTTYSRAHIRFIHTTPLRLDSETQNQSQALPVKKPASKRQQKISGKVNSVELSSEELKNRLNEFIANLNAQRGAPSDLAYKAKTRRELWSTPGKPIPPKFRYNPFSRYKTRPRKVTRRYVKWREMQRQAHLAVYEQRLVREEWVNQREAQRRVPAPKDWRAEKEKRKQAAPEAMNNEEAWPGKAKENAAETTMDKEAFKQALQSEQSDEMKALELRLKGQKVTEARPEDDDEEEEKQVFNFAAKKKSHLRRMEKTKGARESEATGKKKR